MNVRLFFSYVCVAFTAIHTAVAFSCEPCTCDDDVTLLCEGSYINHWIELEYTTFFRRIVYVSTSIEVLPQLSYDAYPSLEDVALFDNPRLDCQELYNFEAVHTFFTVTHDLECDATTYDDTTLQDWSVTLDSLNLTTEFINHSSAQEQSRTSVYIAISLAFIVICVAVIIGVVCVRRRRHQQVSSQTEAEREMNDLCFVNPAYAAFSANN